MFSVGHALIALALITPVASTAGGALKLDNYTMDKILALPDHTTLVKFDQSYAYGEKEDEFKTLCKLAFAVPKFFIGEVPVQEYGDKDNDDLRERYKLTKDDFPAFFLFNAANKDGLRYSGGIKADEIAAWLRRNKVSMPAVGTIAELDAIAKQFMQDGMKPEQIQEAKKLAEGDYKTDRKAAMYVKIMEKVQDKGASYLETETKRVEKILAGKLTPEKMSEIKDKMTILAMFSEKSEL